MYALYSFTEDDDGNPHPGSRTAIMSFMAKPSDDVLAGWLRRYGIPSDTESRQALLDGDSCLMKPRGTICELVKVKVKP